MIDISCKYSSLLYFELSRQDGEYKVGIEPPAARIL